MKTRNGFVSNSSSSSFIVAFDRVPETVGELQRLLFAEETFYKNPYFSHIEGDYPVEQVALTVFNDIEKPLSEEEALEELTYADGPDGPDCPRYDDFRRDDGSVNHHAYCEAVTAFAKRQGNKFIDANKGKVLLHFRYSDNDGAYFCALEHGDLFKRLPHVCISHH